MKKNVPFVPNEPDNLHCFQASYMTIAKYFDSDFDIPMSEWSKITGFENGSWATAGLLWFKNNGYDVKHISLFDYPDFAKQGAYYLKREYSEETAKWQIENSNIPAEMKRAKKLIASELIEKREPTDDDIRSSIDSGFLVRLLVNSHKLDGIPGYVGHTVVIFNYDEIGVTMHDPGLPPLPNRHVTWEKLESAWADPNTTAKELDAIKLP